MPTLKKGFYHPISIIILALITLTVALAIFANSGFFANKNVPTPPSPTPQPSPKPSPKISPAGETTNWKTYTNTKYKYSFKHPTDSEVVNGVEQLPDTPADATKDSTTNAILVQSTKQGGNYFGLYVIPYANNINTFKIDLQKKGISSVTIISVNGIQSLSYTDSGSKYIELFNSGYEYQIIITEQVNTSQILSTFQFLN